MKRKICPFYQKECLGTRCMLWGVNTCLIAEELGDLTEKITEHVKLLLKTPKSSELIDDVIDSILEEEYPKEKSTENQQSKEIDELSEPSTDSAEILDEDIEKSDKTKDELMKLMNPTPISDHKLKIPEFRNKTDKEIAEDLADFCLKKKPKATRWYELRLVSEMFWESHNAKSYFLPSDRRLKIEEIEELAEKIFFERKIPKHLWEGTIEELADEMLNELKEECLKIFKDPKKYLEKHFSWGFKKLWQYGRFKNIDIYNLPEELQIRFKMAKERFEDKIDEERDKELRKRVEEAVVQFLEWLKKKKLEEITPLYLNTFIFESGLKIPMEVRPYIEFTAREQYHV